VDRGLVALVVEAHVHQDHAGIEVTLPPVVKLDEPAVLLQRVAIEVIGSEDPSQAQELRPVGIGVLDTLEQISALDGVSPLQDDLPDHHPLGREHLEDDVANVALERGLQVGLHRDEVIALLPMEARDEVLVALQRVVVQRSAGSGREQVLEVLLLHLREAAELHLPHDDLVDHVEDDLDPLLQLVGLDLRDGGEVFEQGLFVAYQQGGVEHLPLLGRDLLLQEFVGVPAVALEADFDHDTAGTGRSRSGFVLGEDGEADQPEGEKDRPKIPHRRGRIIRR
jgi:hypothetical protein